MTGKSKTDRGRKRAHNPRSLRIESLERRDLLAADLVVAEVVADNEGGLTDQDGDWTDWVEITNQGDESINLDGWFLSDDSANLDQWRFPSTNLAAGQSIVVFASDKDRNDSGSELHANFSLDRDGESVLLVRPDGDTVASQLRFPFMPENTSFGTDAAGGTGYFAQPTPGMVNVAFTKEVGALVVDVSHQPEHPIAGEDLIITAEVDLLTGVPTSVTLQYVVGFGNVISVSMVDDGMGSDATAGDGVYSAVISASRFDDGDMVRWFVNTVTDNGITTRSLPWDPLVVDRSNAAEYHGTMIQDGSVDTNLPVLYWFVQNSSAAETENGTRASVYYDGEFYDNVFVRRRGGSTSGLPKKSFKFDFNQGHHFRFDPELPRVSEINLNTTYSDKSYIRAGLAFEVFDQLGAPGSIAFPMRMQRNGDFFSISTFVEQPDEDLLVREGLDPNGALYKSFSYFSTSSGNFEKKTRQHESNADLDAFISRIRNSSGNDLTEAIFDTIDVPAVLNNLVANVLVQNNDQQRKNYYLYRDSEGTGEWLILPWDLDLTFGRHWMTPNSIGGGGNNGDGIWAEEDRFVYSGSSFASPSHPLAGEAEHPGNRSWNRLIDKLFENDVFREMYLRRLRTAMDTLLQPTGTEYQDRFIEQRIDELVAEIGDDATRDYQRWRSGSELDIQQAIEDIKDDYLAIRRQHLFVTHSDASDYADSAGIPAAAIIDPNLEFGEIEASPLSGDQDQEYIQILNPRDSAVDISGWRLTGGVEHTFRPGTVIGAQSELYAVPDAAAFRSRSSGPAGGQGHFVQGGYQGHLSNAGESIQLVSDTGRVVATFEVPDARSDVQRYLRVSELNYNPTVPGDATEFIEITNISDSVSLDLTGASITDGPSDDFFFDFGTTLSPGDFRLIVKDRDAFRVAYPGVPEWQVIGEFAGGLSNGGEAIRVEDANNNTVLEIEYSDAYPWPVAADGAGATLELKLGEIDTDSPTEKHFHWQASQLVGGSPGAANSAFFNVVISEVLSNSGMLSDSIELYNPATVPVDVGGWYLSDAADELLKYRIPAETVISPGGYVIFDESQFNPNPASQGPDEFGLNGTEGDDVWLTIADGAGQPLLIVDDVHFGAAREGVSFTRVSDRDVLVATSRNSLGGFGHASAVSNVVISEVHYHPADPSLAAVAAAAAIDASDLEFVEVTNQGESPIDLSGWRLGGGVEYVFPVGWELDPGDTFVVGSFDAADSSNADQVAAFRSEFGASGQPDGEYSGTLSDSTESIRLYAAFDGLESVLVDEVLYDDSAPWPAADGTGGSLVRQTGLVSGNDFSNWELRSPSPGQSNLQGVRRQASADLNRDGVVDPRDIDLLTDLIVQSSSASNVVHSIWLDFDEDGLTTIADARHWIEEIAGFLPGDGNFDGRIDAEDFAIWNANRFGVCGRYSSGDFNLDGITDVSDFNVWLANQERVTAAQSGVAGSAGLVAEVPKELSETTGALDVSGDGVISPLDALQVINLLHDDDGEAGARSGSADVNADGTVSPLDALLVINYLNDSQSVAAASVDFVFEIEDEDD